MRNPPNLEDTRPLASCHAHRPQRRSRGVLRAVGVGRGRRAAQARDQRQRLLWGICRRRRAHLAPRARHASSTASPSGRRSATRTARASAACRWTWPPTPSPTRSPGQIAHLADLAKAVDGEVTYVKPHGALYNTIVSDEVQAAAVVEAVREAGVPIVGLPGAASLRLARAAGVAVVLEGFADRGYTDEGTLIPRSEPGALLADSARRGAPGGAAAARRRRLDLRAQRQPRRARHRASRPGRAGVRRCRGAAPVRLQTVRRPRGADRLRVARRGAGMVRGPARGSRGGAGRPDGAAAR